MENGIVLSTMLSSCFERTELSGLLLIEWVNKFTNHKIHSMLEHGLQGSIFTNLH